MRQLTLVTRTGCHLCDDARIQLEQLRAEQSFELREVSVDEHPELRSKYSDHVPVVMLDGAVIAFWTVDTAQVKAALENPAVPVSLPLL